MFESFKEKRVILIGGSSHVGKTTVAQALASQLGCCHISTDSLARHPGRPWRNKPDIVPPHVVEHYSSLSLDELLEDVLRHYRSMWSGIGALINSHAKEYSFDKLILEGSAILPECVATLKVDNVSAIWLTASDELFKKRIYKDSQFTESSSHEKALIQKFLDRTQHFNKRIIDDVKQFELVSIDVETTSSLEELVDTCLTLIRK